MLLYACEPVGYSLEIRFQVGTKTMCMFKGTLRKKKGLVAIGGHSFIRVLINGHHLYRGTKSSIIIVKRKINSVQPLLIKQSLFYSRNVHSYLKCDEGLYSKTMQEMLK